VVLPSFFNIDQRVLDYHINF